MKNNEKVYYTDFEFEKLPEINDEKNKKIYINAPMTFDIETSSYYTDSGNKQVTMYLWQFAIYGKYNRGCCGRTWSEFKEFLKRLVKFYHINQKRKCIIYVHNLGYETAFLQGEFNIKNSFATKPHKPMYIEIDNFIFKCSYFLSGLSLKKTLEDCNCPRKWQKTKLESGYELIRHSETPLTKREYIYGFRDVLGLAYYIKTEIEKNGNNILNIPLTKTGYARRYVREHCFKTEGYKEFIDKIQVKDFELFKQLQNAYCGAYNHANPTKIEIPQRNVKSLDFTSSYPSVMIRHNKYPVSEFTKLEVKHYDVLMKMCKKYACVFTIQLENVYAKTVLHTISQSKCNFGDSDRREIIVDNGRVVTAPYLITTITNIDFLDICELYNFDKDRIKVCNFYYAEQGYLPKPFIECILKLYADKTLLKGVKGKEDIYLVSKGMLNSLYGMCCTSPIQENYKLISGEWEKRSKPEKIALRSYYTNKKTFLTYSWGVWCTALARHELYDGIITTLKNNDWVYSDTDSIKYTDDFDIYDDYVKNYNIKCTAELQQCLKYYNLPLDSINPDGKHPLGVWDYEGKYISFKTLGCKRYIYIDSEGDLHITISGLNKDIACKYISAKGGMKFFNRNLSIPAKYSGRTVSTYRNIGEMQPYELTDYLGNKYLCTDKSGLHLEKCDYNINFAMELLHYLTEGKNKPEHQRIDNIFIDLIGE